MSRDDQDAMASGSDTPQGSPMASNNGNNNGAADDGSDKPMWSLSLSNLNPDLSDAELKAFFQELPGGSDIYSAQVARDSNGESKGYGFVHYLSASSYTSALDEYAEGIEIAGRLSKATAADDKRKIYVRNLPRDMDEKQVQQEIEAITGKSDSFNLSGKGDFCFITYVNFLMAEKALKALNSATVGGNQLHAEQAKQRDSSRTDTDGPPNTSLHVRNISRNTTADSLREHFAPIGKIRDVRVPKPRDGAGNSGFAFVEFEEAEDARRAISRLARSSLDGATIEVCFSKSKAQGGGRRDDDRRGGGGRRDDDRRGGDRYDPYGARGGMPAAAMMYAGMPYGMYPPMGGARGGPQVFPPAAYGAYPGMAAYMYPGAAGMMGGAGAAGAGAAGGAAAAQQAAMRGAVGVTGAGGAAGGSSTTAFPAGGYPGMGAMGAGGAYGAAAAAMYDPRYAAMYASMMGAAGPMGGASGKESSSSSKRRGSRSRSPKRRDRSASGSRSRSRSRERKRR